MTKFETSTSTVIATTDNQVEGVASTSLSTPHDLLAAVPFLIGYHPKDSLVVISLKGGSIGMAMRVDFPTNDQKLIAVRGATLTSHLVRENAEGAIVIGYLPSSLLKTLDPLRPYIEKIEAADIAIQEIIEVRKDRFRSLLCTDILCCPADGTEIPPLSDSRITAEQVALGRPMPFLDLEEMQGSISALPKSAESRALKSAINKFEESEVIEDADNDEQSQLTQILENQREGARAVDLLAQIFIEQGSVTDLHLIAQVLVRLQDLQVRDYSMGISTIDTVEQLWSMWRWLLRIAPKGYVAPVAVIFATMSYEKGEGALAQRALERALEDDSRYQMAKLLRRTFAAGWPPESFTKMRQELHPKICAALFDGE